MISVSSELIKPLARKYIWWKSPDEAAIRPERVIAQVMNIGDFADVAALNEAIGDAAFVDVLTHAEAGSFNARSWTYWHYRLRLAQPGQVPPMPIRQIE